MSVSGRSAAHRSKVLPWIILLGAVLGGAESPLAGAVVEKIKITGNTLSSEPFIRKHIKTREGQELSELTLNDDVKRLYDLGRFKKIEILREERKDKVEITVAVQEKPLIRKRKFSGNKKLKDGDFTKEVKSAPDQRFDEGMVAADREAILKIYRDRGYLFAEVGHKVAPAGADRADLTFIIRENQEVKIGGIEFKGNQHVEAKQLRKLMETKIDRFYNRGVYDADHYLRDLDKIAAYYKSIGYLDAKAKPGKSLFSEDRNWLYLNVVVEEGALYILDRLELKGNKVLSAAELTAFLPLKAGMPYSDYARVEAEDAVERRYGEIGRIFTSARARAIIDQKSAHVGLVMEIEEGEEVYVEKVKIYGNVKSRDVVVRRELEFFPLERVNTEIIRRSKRNLMNLGFFESAEILPEPGSAPHLANIVVRVKEKQTGSINFSLGFSSIEAIFAQLKYQQRNFDWRDRQKGPFSLFTGQGYIGDGQNLEIAINTGTRSRRFTIDFSEPWVFNRKIRFGIGLFHAESTIADFDEQRRGGYLRLGREFLRDLEGFLTYNLSEITISNIDPGVSPAIKEQEGDNLVSSVRNEWVYDDRDNRFLPTKGWYMHLSELLAGGPFGGTEDFYKLDLETKTYRRLFKTQGGAHTGSARLELGFGESYGDTETLPIFDRYFAGGLGSVRGFENRTLSPRVGSFEVGGEFLTVMNLEYGFPISEETLRGVVFYDQGFAWDKPSDFNYDDLRSAIGTGLRIQIDALGPVPIALNFARPIHKKPGDRSETFSFNFGNFF